MTNEKIIAVLETAKAEIASPHTYAQVEETIAALRAEIAAKNAKAAGKQDLYKAMLAVIKNAKKESPYKEAFHGAWMDNGKQYVCDGRMLIENGGTPLDLPTLPDDVSRMNVQPILKAKAEKEYPDVLTCPTIAELKSGIAEQKAQAKFRKVKIKSVDYHFGGGHRAKAEFLQVAVQATGSTTIHAENRKAGRENEYQVGELWFESEDRTIRVLVLPIREYHDSTFTGFTYKD